jgi:hypothetical protein
VTPGQKWQASVNASDPDQDALTWHWAVLPELQGHQNNGRKVPEPIPGTISDPSAASASITAPTKPGFYRLYVWVKDGKGHAATANVPLEVR